MRRRKTLILWLALIFAAVETLSAQTAATPANNSPVRKAVIAAVARKFGKTQPHIERPSVLKVQGNWARVVYSLRQQGDEGSTGVNLILKKNGAAWKIVWDYNEGGEEDPGDHLAGIPPGILMPWEK